MNSGFFDGDGDGKFAGGGVVGCTEGNRWWLGCAREADAGWNFDGGLGAQGCAARMHGRRGW